MNYYGRTVNFKTYSKSHKLKKRTAQRTGKSADFPQYPMLQLLRKHVFERVQELRANKRRPTKSRTARVVLRLALLR